MARDWKIQCCPKCGAIKILNFEWEKDCEYCGYKLQDTEYYFIESVDHGNLKPEIRKAIFEKYIKNSPLYSEEYAKQREEKQTRESMNLPSSYKAQQQNIPKCPTCGSTNIKRITTANRAVSVLTLGILSGKIGKNYECLDCKAKW